MAHDTVGQTLKFLKENPSILILTQHQSVLLPFCCSGHTKVDETET